MAKMTARGDVLSTGVAELRGKLLRDGSLVLDVKVVPRAAASEVTELLPDGALKVKVKAAPEKGKANEELCAVLASFLNVPKRNVNVILGHTSHKKRVKIRV